MLFKRLQAAALFALMAEVFSEKANLADDPE